MLTCNKTRVAICVATFRRPDLLCLLLEGISQLTFERVQPPEIRIIVVDNDDLRSAEQVCSNPLIRWPVKYVVEARRGITYTRNRAVAEAMPVDFVALIDDDEVPSPYWLDELLWTQAHFNADVVSGPVLPRYTPDVAEWVRRGGFFDGRVSTTGAIRRACATNNVLIGTHVFTQVPEFDDAFALSGAEDTDFFLRVWKAGYKIVWSQDAVVFEAVSAERGTVSWILRREYQTGNGWIFCEAGIDNRPRTRALRLLKAAGHIVIGSAAATGSVLSLNKVAIVRSLRRVSLGTGMLAALVGHRFLAYRNVKPAS